MKDDIEKLKKLHTSGGMRRRSGMYEKQRNPWTMSRPVTSENNIAMQQFTNLSYTTTTKQHKDSPEARMKRDVIDLEKISSKPVMLSPFSPDSSLGDLVTGVVTDERA